MTALSVVLWTMLDGADIQGEAASTVGTLSMNLRIYSAQVSLTQSHSSVWLAPA